MCGIAGFWEVGRAISHDSGLATLKIITDSIRHRGPDDEGAWLDPPAGLALGFRRLAIIDTSSLGHQPMASASGRYVIVFNGEIYNYRDIRAELEAQGPLAWRGHSDTEVMLAAIDRWGFDATLSRLNGMFAIALWDRRERVLHLARDRFGEKPLYYGWAGRTFLFGSELKALKRHPAWVGEVRRDAVSAYTRYGYVPAPMSIYRGIVKLPPAHATSITAGTSPGALPPPRCYWDVHAVADAGIANRLTLDEHELTECLDSALQSSVRSRMEADVPLGAFLSGGIDSSTVVALMQAASSRPVRTFTIGFGERAFNEAPFGAAVAKHLGTQHEELYVSADQALAVVPKIASMYDEPFGDASQIPTYLVAALARKHVTVALSGDGGDEMFFGYERYFRAERIWAACRRVPRPVRGGLAAGALSIPMGAWDRLSAVFPARVRPDRLGDRIHKFAGMAGAASGEALYTELLSYCRNVDSLVRDGGVTPELYDHVQAMHPGATLGDRMMLIDQLTYLPDDILVKVDRATMAVSLEGRAPFLDHKLAELAWRIPPRMRALDGAGKWPLRAVLRKYVPKELVERPKTGFGIPITQWLRGPLNGWASELLRPARLAAEGFFDPEQVRREWDDTISGRRDWGYHLWNLLMFQAWLAEEPSAVRSSPIAA